MAEWQVSLNPTDDLETTVNNAWTFLEYLLLQAKTERVFEIVADFYDNDQQKLDYVSYCKMKYYTESKLNLLPSWLRGKDKFPFRQEVCCYNLQGEVEAFTTQNLGGLLESLRPDIQNDNLKFDYMPPIIGLNIYQVRTLLNSSSIQKKPIDINIQIPSNIWFPKVIDQLGDKYDYDADDYVWVDNRELAACNTPRLNRFLMHVREKALEMKGGWELIEVHTYFHPEAYEEMVSVDGIII